jgi:uncharacterized protein (TIGR00303 family)
MTMKIYTLFDTKEAALPAGKADFLLAASVTRTCEIEGITQAGIPGKIPLTPTLDAEFVTTGRVFSLENLAETASGIPTPGLLTRAVQTLSPFAAVKILDLGLVTAPQGCDIVGFGIAPSPSIADAAPFDAKGVFEKGRQFGRSYKPAGDYVIVGESTPAGTTTAQAAIAALGFESDGLFASSFRNAPVVLKEQVLEAALGKLQNNMPLFEKLGHTGDNTLMFVAGFVLEASRRFEVVLGGGTQMAAALLIANRIAGRDGLPMDPRKITLCTTRWIADDGASNITALLEQLDFRPHALYADFRYADATIPVLKLYDEGEAKEGVGAGAAVAYGYMQGLDQKSITEAVEAMMAAPAGAEEMGNRE